MKALSSILLPSLAAAVLLGGCTANVSDPAPVARGETRSNPAGLAWRVHNRPYQAVAFGNGVYVGLRDAGTISTSPDAETWTDQDSGTPQKLVSVVFSGGQFVAVGRAGSICTSPDGSHWTAQVTGITKNLVRILDDGTRLVLLDEAGVVRTSADALNWTQVGTLGLQDGQFLQDLAFGNGSYVAVGISFSTGDERAVWRSTDLQTWTLTLLPGYPYHKVLYDGTNFLAIAPNDEHQAWTSPDGAAWVSHPVPAAGQTLLAVLASNGSRDVIVGSPNEAFYSDDHGQTWSKGSAAARTGFPRDALFANGRFVAAGDSGVVSRTADGLTWTSRPYPVTTQSLAASPVAYYAADYYDNSVIQSKDGLDWHPIQPLPTGNNIFQGVAAGGGRVFACVNNITNGEIRNTLLTSSDEGATWASSTPAEVVDTAIPAGTGIAYVGDALMIMGRYYDPAQPNSNGHAGIASSLTAGQSFQVFQSIQFGRSFLDAAFGNGVYVACGSDDAGPPILYTSTDSVQWTERTLPQGDYGFEGVTGVDFEAGRFIAITGGPLVLTSTDGTDWTALPIPLSLGIERCIGLGSGNGLFVFSVIYTDRRSGVVTFDGHNLQNFPLGGIDVTIQRFAYGPTGFVGVGGDGTIVTSP